MENSKQPNTKLYVAYGSNLNTTQMKYRCPTAKIVGSDMLEDYKLLFRGRDGSAVATIEAMKGYCVPVLIWEVTPTDEAALDVYEGFPTFYRKETITVRLGEEKREAFVYIMNIQDEHGNVRELGKPGCYYFNTILEGYRRAACAHLYDFDANLLLEARCYSERCHRGIMSDQVVLQILTIKDSGETNMFDIEAVCNIAVRDGHYALADYLVDHEKDYVQFILTGKRKTEKRWLERV